MAWCRQTITWANVDPDLCRHMASLGHSVLTLNPPSPSDHVYIQPDLAMSLPVYRIVLLSVGPPWTNLAEWSLKYNRYENSSKQCRKMSIILPRRQSINAHFRESAYICLAYSICPINSEINSNHKQSQADIATDIFMWSKQIFGTLLPVIWMYRLIHILNKVATESSRINSRVLSWIKTTSGDWPSVIFWALLMISQHQFR